MLLLLLRLLQQQEKSPTAQETSVAKFVRLYVPIRGKFNSGDSGQKTGSNGAVEPELWEIIQNSDTPQLYLILHR